MNKAVRKYVEFHAHEPNKVGAFNPSFAIPETARLAGEAVHVLYRSDKLNPTTLEDEGWVDYIHEHDAGVKVYRCDADADGAERAVPAWLRNTRELTWLGQCLGFAYKVDGKEVGAEGSAPLPDLYATPNGKALLVIQGKRKVLALIWGGRLGVEARGIVH